MPKRIFNGTVSSAKMDKTVVVTVDIPRSHKLYSKKITLSKNFLANDPVGVSEGDYVMIEESRPLSKRVSWKVVKKLNGMEE